MTRPVIAPKVLHAIQGKLLRSVKERHATESKAAFRSVFGTPACALSVATSCDASLKYQTLRHLKSMLMTLERDAGMHGHCAVCLPSESRNGRPDV
jgi:hypothetical protein